MTIRLSTYRDEPKFFSTDEAEKAAITLQRAFRYSRPALQALVRSQKPLSDTEALKLALQKRGLQSFPMDYIPRPKPGTYKVDPREARQWVAEHSPEIRSLAKKFIQCITYRSHQKFERQLQLTAQDFNRRLAAMPEDKRNYMIVFYKGSDGFNSSAWVQLIALKYLNTKYLVGIHNHWALGPNSSYDAAKKELETCNNLLICDDGSYSGAQNIKIVHYLWYWTGKEIFVAIPFMTQQSKELISQAKKDLLQAPFPTPSSMQEDPALFHKVCKNIRNVRFQICKHQRMLTCAELGIKYAKLSGLSLFIFNHKIACPFSAPNEIFVEGWTLPTYAKSLIRGRELSKLIQAHRRGNVSENSLLVSQEATENVPFVRDADTLPIYKQLATRIKSSL